METRLRVDTHPWPNFKDGLTFETDCHSNYDWHWLWCGDWSYSMEYLAILKQGSCPPKSQCLGRNLWRPKEWKKARFLLLFFGKDKIFCSFLCYFCSYKTDLEIQKRWRKRFFLFLILNPNFICLEGIPVIQCGGKLGDGCSFGHHHHQQQQQQ